MKRIPIFIFILIIPPFLFGQFGLSSYDVEEVFCVQDVENGTMAIARFGKIEEIEKILIPIRLDLGRYRVSIKKVDINLYEINGKDIYIKTRNCYKSAYNEEIILEITTSFGWNKGKLHFDN